MLSMLKPKIKSGLLSVQAGERLLRKHAQKVTRISKLTSLTADAFKTFYIDTLISLADYVQELPASEMHHHSAPGGLLDHLLDTAINALTLRRGELLPPGVHSEAINKQAELWTYAVFIGSILHDIGKAVVDQRVIVCDKRGNPYGTWNPLSGSIIKNDFKNRQLYYRIQFVKNRKYRVHERVGLLVAQHIVPAKGIDWLRTNIDVFNALVSLLTGHAEDAGVLGQLVYKADGESVGKNLGAKTGVVANRIGDRPLHEKLLTSIRYLISEGKLPINRSGAAVFVKGHDTWLICKRVVDSVREHLLSEGHSGIPNSNDRIFDILQEHQLAIPCEGKAIWKCDIKIGEKVHKLTFLRMQTNVIWPNIDHTPEDYSGQIIPISGEQGESNMEAAVQQASTSEPMVNINVHDNDYPKVQEPVIITGQDNIQHDYQDDYSENGYTNQEEEAALSEYESDTAKNTADTDDSENIGQMFFDWVCSGLKDGNIRYNNEQSRIHVVQDGIFLVSPGIFKDYLFNNSEVESSWKTVQNKFQKLKKHIKNEKNMNIHTYIVTGGRRKSKINGYLLPGIEPWVGNELASIMKPNPFLGTKSV